MQAGCRSACFVTVTGSACCPVHVDAVTGYRMYEARQLSRLNRIVALKDLGFTLAQVRAYSRREGQHR